jgi:Tfp pilus assembly protein PilF
MGRLFARGLGVWLACGLALSGLGCATLSGKTSEEDARKATSHLDVGSDHLANGRSALALREYLAAEKLDPRNARVQYALADAFLARGKRAEAEQHARRSLELFPDYQDARLFLSALLLIEKRYAEAIPECDRLVNDPTFPSPWRALTNRAWAEFKLGHAKEARESLELAHEYRSDYWPATLALAIIEGEAGHRTEAIRLFRTIIAQNPGASVESEVNYRLAEIYVALGKRREAVGHLTTSVARAPESTWAKKSQAYLKRLN